MKKMITIKIQKKMSYKEALGYIRDCYSEIMPEGMTFKAFIAKAGGEDFVMDQFRIWYENNIRTFDHCNLEEVNIPCLDRVCYPDDFKNGECVDLVEGDKAYL